MRARLMRGDDVRAAIEAELEQWPGASITFEGKGRGPHPKARLEFKPEEGDPLILRRAYSDQTEDRITILKNIADIRAALGTMGATRKAKPTAAGDEKAVAKYVKPNPGREQRPDPVERDLAAPRPTIGDKLVKVGLATTAMAAALVAVPGEVEAEPIARAAQEAAWQATADQVVDGIYFRMPDEVYHRVNRLSTSGIQRMCVSAGTFWEESWLNLNPRKLTEEQQERKEKTRILGRAYHCARLEPWDFDTRYGRKAGKADFDGIEGVLWNGTQVGEMLAEWGETKKRSGESVAEQCQRLVDCGYEHPIWPLEEARAEAALAGRIGLSAVDFDNIKIDMERLNKSREVAELLEDGQPEVSIFWTDRYGIQMKCRCDYLAASRWVDFKTFTNTQGKKLRQAINDAMRFNRYHIQAVTYRDGIEAVRVGGLQIVGEATDDERKLIAQIQVKPGELECWFVFQEKSGVPNLVGKRFNFFHVPASARMGEAGATEEQIERQREAVRTKTGIHIRAMGDIDDAKREYDLYSKVYPPGEPWGQVNPLSDFEDDDFPRNWLERHWS
jgi:hypothetical protein